MNRAGNDPIVNIIFRNTDHSDALEHKIRDRIDKLSHMRRDIVSCHVVIEMHHRHHQQGNHFHVLVDVAIPGQELLTYNQSDKNKFYSDPFVAVRDAFDAMDRKLRDVTERQRGQIKTHQV